MGKVKIAKKKYLILLLLQFWVFTCFAASISSISSGTWDSPSTWPGGVVPSINDDVTIDHTITISAGTFVEINSLNVGSSGKITIDGSLILNGNLSMANNSPELITGSAANVFIYGSAYLDNKVSINLSSYFIVLGDFVKSGANNQGSISIDGAHVYVLGTITSAWTSFTSCEPGSYDGTTTTVNETCDAGSFEDVINNLDPDDLPDGFYEEIETYKTIDTTTLDASGLTICSGNTITLTINDSRSPLTKISWLRNGKKFLNNTTQTFVDTISVSGEYYALYFYNNIWYRTNKIVITSGGSSSFTAGSILTTNETICYGGNPGIIGSSVPASSSGGTITYQWQSSADAAFTSPVTIASNTATYDPPANITANTWYRRQARDNACNTTFTSSTGVWAVTVRPAFNAGAINTAGETICFNGDPSIIGNAIIASGGDNNITYEWRANGTPIVGSNSVTYDPPAGLIATTTYTRLAHDNNCNLNFTASSGNWVVTVSPLPTVTLSSADTEVCAGDILATVGYSATTGSPNQYSIDFDATAEAQGFVDVTNASLSAGFIEIAVPVTGAPADYNAVLTVNNSTSGCTSATSNIKVIIHPLPDTSEITTN